MRIATKIKITYKMYVPTYVLKLYNSSVFLMSIMNSSIRQFCAQIFIMVCSKYNGI